MKKLTLLSALLLLSCGSVKKNKTHELTESETNASKETKTEQTSTNVENVKESQQSNKNTLIHYNLTQFEFEPFDNTKPFFINGQKYENVKVKNKEDKTITKIDETWKTEIEIANKRIDSLTQVIAERKSEVTETKKSNKIKETDNTKIYLMLFGFLLLLIILAFVYKKINPLA